MRLNERKTMAAADELALAAELVGRAEPDNPSLLDEWVEVWIEVGNLDYFAQHRIEWAVGAVDRIEAAVKRRGDIRQMVLTDRTRALTLQMDSRFTGPEELLGLLRRQLAGAIECGDLPMTADATFGMAFTYMCRLDGRSAVPLFDEALALHERVGDEFWRTLAIVYGAASRRLRGDVDETEARTSAAMPLARELPIPSYLAVLEGNLAWCALRRHGEGRWPAGESGPVPPALLSSLRDHLKHPSVENFYPFLGFMVWPAMYVASVDQRDAAVAEYAEMMVGPAVQQLPDDVDAILRTVMAFPRDPSLETAFAWARSVNLL